jgi:hypothetical protein
MEFEPLTITNIQQLISKIMDWRFIYFRERRVALRFLRLCTRRDLRFIRRPRRRITPPGLPPGGRRVPFAKNWFAPTPAAFPKFRGRIGGISIGGGRTIGRAGAPGAAPAPAAGPRGGVCIYFYG